MDRWVLAVVWTGLAGCRPQPATPRAPPPPTAARAEAPPAQAPAGDVEEPAEPVDEVEPPQLPAAEMFVRSESNEPDDNWHVSDDCPGGDACMFSMDFAVFIARKGWDRVFIIDYGTAGGAIREANTRGEITWARVEYGVRHVFETMGVERARGSCGLLSRVPGLYAAGSNPLKVEVPPIKKRLPAPKALSPKGANAKIAAAFEKYDASMAADPFVAFRKEDIGNMTADALDEPRLANLRADHSSAINGGPWKESRVNIHVIYAPTGRRVYVLDGSYYERARETVNGLRWIARRRRRHEQRVVRTLQALGLKSIQIPLSDACFIPDTLGDHQWFDLQLNQTEQARERLEALVTEGHTVALEARQAAH